MMLQTPLGIRFAVLDYLSMWMGIKPKFQCMPYGRPSVENCTCSFDPATGNFRIGKSEPNNLLRALSLVNMF
jgi:hypothetical protein